MKHSGVKHSTKKQDFRYFAAIVWPEHECIQRKSFLAINGYMSPFGPKDKDIFIA